MKHEYIYVLVMQVRDLLILYVRHFKQWVNNQVPVYLDGTG